MTGEVVLETRVVRSRRRRKTVEATLVDGVLEVRVPATMSKADERRFVEDMRTKFERRWACDDEALDRRARRLADRHDLPRPDAIRWVDNQEKRWGSCSPDRGEVRISSRLARYPGWVVDYVIVHELAHLVEANHSARFHALVGRYPQAERAEGFLTAMGIGADGEERIREQPDPISEWQKPNHPPLQPTQPTLF